MSRPIQTRDIDIVANGRVNLLDATYSQNPQITDSTNTSLTNKGTGSSSYKEAMTGNWERSVLSDTFFSRENIQIIQNGIRAGVYEMSNNQYSIAEQDVDTIKTIMRAVFLEHATNNSTHVRDQIQKLNQIILEFSIKQVYGEAEGYMKYKRDVSVLPVPMAHPTHINNTKTLELKPWF